MEEKKHFKVGYTTGVYDLFHIGHLNLLRRAKEQCDKLIVGVSVDELVLYKNKRAVIPFEERIEIVRAIRYVDQLERRGTLSPEAWVGMLLNSAYVVTNSFHGAAFAVNLQKRASIFVPPEGGERVKNLLDSCNLTRSISESVMPESIKEVYADAVEYLSRERKRAMSYIDGLLHA